MNEKNPIALNIVSFNNPYPPDLGGLIDVYYRIKQLHKEHIEIHLHTFNYDRDQSIVELNKLCASVTFYKRKKSLYNFLSFTPFIVKSRKDKTLLENLCQNNFPILFEGTHCCAYLNHPKLSGRYKLVRMHNVEGDYYQQLAKSESSAFKQFYYRSEAFKLKHFDEKLEGASVIVTVSEEDKKHYQKINKTVALIPCSHQFDQVKINPGKGEYALYHGNLSVPENEEAALFLVNKVFKYLDHPLIIAGKNPTERLIKDAKNSSTISIQANPSQDEMENLLANAQLLVLPTFQSTGLKLKLLYSLFRGRFCIVNDQMLVGTHLRSFCQVANSAAEMKDAVNKLMKKSFGTKELKSRQELETGMYSNQSLVDSWKKLILQQNILE